MTTFALVAEGITDQLVIEHLIALLCEDKFEDGVDINPLQPLRDATDSGTAPHGGWELVLEYCEEKIGDALSANDYVVVHLDTDEGDHPGFGVPLTYEGSDRSYTELIADCVALLRDKLGASYDEASDRFIFAIAVHSIESWLILCLFGKDETKNAFYRLNRQLVKETGRTLKKDARSYRALTYDIKRKSLNRLVDGGHSLGVFLQKLSGLSA